MEKSALANVARHEKSLRKIMKAKGKNKKHKSELSDDSDDDDDEEVVVAQKVSKKAKKKKNKAKAAKLAAKAKQKKKIVQPSSSSSERLALNFVWFSIEYNFLQFQICVVVTLLPTADLLLASIIFLSRIT